MEKITIQKIKKKKTKGEKIKKIEENNKYGECNRSNNSKSC